jgi:hypothetical protein
MITKARRFFADAATAILGLFIVGVLGLCFITLLVLSIVFPPGERWLRPREKTR